MTRAAWSAALRGEAWLGLLWNRLDGVLGRGRRFRRGRNGRRTQVRRLRCAGAQLDDPVAQDAVRDLEVVVELLEELVLTPELDEVVVGLSLLADLVSGLAAAPVVAPEELAGAVDEVCDVGHDLLTTVGLDCRVEEEGEVVDVLS